MAENEVSNWQNIADWNKSFLIQMYMNIRDAYQAEEYDYAFKDIEQIFIHIHKEIENIKGGKDRLIKMKEQVSKIYAIKNELGLMKLNNDTPIEYRLEEMSRLQNSMREEVTGFFMEITSVMSELNMFMPKIKIDRREDIYKQ